MTRALGLATITALSPTLFLPHAKAAERFVDFFTANIGGDMQRLDLTQHRGAAGRGLKTYREATPGRDPYAV